MIDSNINNCLTITVTVIDSITKDLQKRLTLVIPPSTVTLARRASTQKRPQTRGMENANKLDEKGDDKFLAGPLENQSSHEPLEKQPLHALSAIKPAHEPSPNIL